MFYPDSFLQTLKQAISVFDLVSKRHKLRKKAANEWQAVDDTSLTINTDKNIWNDFGKGKQGGDIFAFQMFATGCTFEQAVEDLAQMVGITPPGQRRSSSSTTRTGTSSPQEPDDPGPGPSARAAPKQTTRREITAAYDYTDIDGLLIYQACRQEWTDYGKRHKSFFQRRPYGPILEDRSKQNWIWGLGEGVFVRGRDGNFYAGTKDRLNDPSWAKAERITVEACAHMLYRLAEVREEMAQAEDERRAVFLPEGEKDCETLAAWGLLATTNSCGASNWRREHAEELRGADVVVLEDNDEAGRKRGYEIASSLRFVAGHVRVLRWPDHWPECPIKGDVTDWAEAGGTMDRLLEIVDKLPTWTPEQPQSTFNAIRFADLDRPRRRLEWLVKSVLQRGEMSVWYGDWGTGKSFLLTDCAFSIARGVHWFGLRTRPGLVAYQAGEGEIGFGNRMDAYRRHNHVDNDTPFVALPSRINLHDGEKDLERLVAELEAWKVFYNLPLELLVIDTFSAATAGADENSGRDVGPILEKGRKIAVATGCHLAIVHHVPKSGSGPRGWSGFLGNVDSAVFVEDTDHYEEEIGGDNSLIRRTIHQWTVVKQKDAESRLSHQFTLPQVVIGTDHDGDKITSCVVRPVQSREAKSRIQPVPKGWVTLNPANDDIFRALIRAIKDKGEYDPKDVPCPPGTRCCKISDWQQELLDLKVGHTEITDGIRSAVYQRIYRASKAWLPDRVNLIVKSGHWVWRSERKVHTIDRPPAPVPTGRPDQEPILAPNETPETFDF